MNDYQKIIKHWAGKIYLLAWILDNKILKIVLQYAYNTHITTIEHQQPIRKSYFGGYFKIE